MNHPYFCHVFKIQVHLVTEEEESANTYAIHRVNLFKNWYHLGLNVDTMSKRHNVDQFSSPPFFLNHILIQVQFIYNKNQFSQFTVLRVLINILLRTPQKSR